MSGIEVVSQNTPAATLEGQSASDVKEAKPAATEQSVESSEESAPLENAEDETQETDAEGDQESEETEDQPEQVTKPKKGFKKRIDKLRSQLTQRDSELEYLRAQLAEKQTASKEPQASRETVSAEGKPNPDTFETHTEYLEAVADWKLDQREAKREQLEQEKALKTEAQTRNEKYVAKTQEFKAQAKDWDDVLDDVSHVNVPFVVSNEILDSELGPELTYELAKDAEEFERICKLPANQAIKAIAIIENRLLSKKSEAKEKPQLKTTKAPPPLSTVGSKAQAAKSLHELDPDAYMAKRREQIKKEKRY